MQSYNLPSLPLSEEAHVVQFYTQDSFLLTGLCEFVRTALADGQSVILIMTAEHEQGLSKCLRSAGVKVRSAARQGRYMTADADQSLAGFMDGDTPVVAKFLSQMGSLIERARKAALAKDKPVAVFGEMVAVLWAQRRFAAAIELERLWNRLAKNHEIYLRCAYPASGFDGDMKVPYTTVCAEHSQVFPA
jgi:KaiC/GvpD/RAD55 family RecA-like ATPase